MKKYLLSFLLILSVIPVSAWAFQWTFSLEEMPMLVTAVDKSTNLPYYSFYNLVNLGVNVDVDDSMSVKFRLKDSYFALTNEFVTADKQHKLYIDRLSFQYRSDLFSVLAGRDLFVENNGLVLGNLADGLKFSGNFFEFKQRLYVTYSGVYGDVPVVSLPKDVNQFKITPEDYESTNGASRLSAALALEKLGFLTKSVSLMYLQSFDLSSNQIFNPGYLALMSDGPIVGQLTYNATVAYQLGAYSTNLSLSAWAADLSLIYFVPGENKWGATLQVSAASGDDTNTADISERFMTFGRFNTGFVLSPLFSNLLQIRLGGFIKGLNDNLVFQANYAYMMRLNSGDTVNGTYDGEGSVIGHEVSASLSWNFDPNLGVFLQAGYLITGDAIASYTNDFKVIGGMKLSL